jgi:hypothetical protein
VRTRENENDCERQEEKERWGEDGVGYVFDCLGNKIGVQRGRGRENELRKSEAITD